MAGAGIREPGRIEPQEELVEDWRVPPVSSKNDKSLPRPPPRGASQGLRRGRTTQDSNEHELQETAENARTLTNATKVEDPDEVLGCNAYLARETH